MSHKFVESRGILCLDSPLTALSLLPTICLATNAAILLNFFLLSRYTYGKFRVRKNESLDRTVKPESTQANNAVSYEKWFSRSLYFSTNAKAIFSDDSAIHIVLFSSHEEWTGKKPMTIAGVTNWFHNTGLIVWISCPTAVVVVSDYQHSSR